MNTFSFNAHSALCVWHLVFFLIILLFFFLQFVFTHAHGSHVSIAIICLCDSACLSTWWNKTTETKITKLGTGIVHHHTLPTKVKIRVRVRRRRSSGRRELCNSVEWSLLLWCCLISWIDLTVDFLGITSEKADVKMVVCVCVCVVCICVNCLVVVWDFIIVVLGFLLSQFSSYMHIRMSAEQFLLLL